MTGSAGGDRSAASQGHSVAAKIGADGATALEGESSPRLMGSHRYELVSQGPRVGGITGARSSWGPCSAAVGHCGLESNHLPRRHLD